MVKPSHVNWRSYARAQELIRSGAWVVDAEAGTIWSRKTRELLIGSFIPGGYRWHSVESPGFHGGVLRHRVIWESVHGTVPIELEINHKDGDTSNNGIANLEATTHVENVVHANRTGLRVYTSGHAGLPKKLTPDLVREIRRLLADGMTQYQTADLVGVTQSAISDVHRRKCWGHVA